MKDIISKPRELGEIESLKQVIKVLYNASCPEVILNLLRGWVFDLVTDKNKYDKWVAGCKKESKQ